MRLAVSSGAAGSEGLVQRNEKGPVSTLGGEWEALEYDPKMGKKDKTARGAHMVLEFRPGTLANATKIALVQTVLAFKNGGMYSINKTVDDRSVGGVSIDQDEQSRSPLYAADSKKSGKALGAAPIQNGAGEHGYRVYDSRQKIWLTRPAWLEDNPHLRGVNSISKQVFETTALAVEGKDTGTYYGSVRWGWAWQGGNEVKLYPLEVLSYGSMSDSFVAASEQWNKTRTSKGKKPLELPPRRELEIPEPDVDDVIGNVNIFNSIGNDAL